MLLTQTFSGSDKSRHHLIEQVGVASSIDEMLVVHFGGYQPRKENGKRDISLKGGSVMIL